MNVDDVVGLVVEALPALEAGGAVADDRVEALWALLSAGVHTSPLALQALRRFRQSPADPDARRALRVQLGLLLARDADLRRSVEAAWNRTPAPGAAAPAEALGPGTRRSFDADRPPSPPPSLPPPSLPPPSGPRKVQAWLDPADPERPWLVSVVVGIGHRTPEGGVVGGFDEAAVFGPSDDVVTLDVVAASDDFVVESGPQRLRLGRTGPSRDVARFALTVAAAGPGATEGTLTVHLFKDGNFAAGLSVRLRVGPQPAQIVGADELGRPLVRLATLRPRQLCLVIRRTAAGYGVVAFGALRAQLTLDLTPQQVQRMLGDARAAFGDLIAHRAFQDDVRIADDDLAQAALDRLARTGFQLFQTLFYDRGDPAAMQLGDRLCRLAAGAPLTIQIVSDDLFLPWGLLYLADSAAGAAEADRFLGFRHVVEHVLIGAHGDTAAPELPTSPQVTIGVNVNLDIDADYSLTVVADQLTRWDDIARRTAGGTGQVRVRRRTTAGEITAALSDPGVDDDIWYFYCHAAAGSLDDPDGPDAAYLEMTGGGRVGLAELKRQALRPRPLPRQPLVLVNACSSAAMSPLFYGGFLPYFLRRGARGVVGTECDVPAVFAAAWARLFFRAFLAGGRPLGLVLLDLRTRFLEEYRNPLGLLYALYCDADTVAVPGTALGGDPSDVRG